jgi:hypothetical protein
MAGGAKRSGAREAHWRRLILTHRQSGLSVREFCGRSKLRESAFYFWRRELERRRAERQRRRAKPGRAGPARRGRRSGHGGSDGARPSAVGGAGPASAFVAVRVAGQEGTSPASDASPLPAEGALPGSPAFRSAGGRIEIELPGQCRVHVTAPVDRQALADVLAVLEERGGTGRSADVAGDHREARLALATAVEGEPC